MLLTLSVLVVTLSSALAATNCYGDIRNLRPTGVSASQAAVNARIKELESLRSCYDQAADKYCIQASVIGALASRESDGGASLTPDGYGDSRKAWGVLQCDLSKSKLPCLDCGPRTCCHIDMMVGKVLIPFIKEVSTKFRGWSAEQKIQGGVAAYNFGVTNVRSWEGLDKGTTGNDYSNDVMARAQRLQALGWS
ncbi:glycine, glutamate and proline-rich protein-like isoform X2 [Pomacea canaliculata]|uniref:glycine, glutamate and proline-rich protein-like isoform X2 n=1 Tax=Pomacea canaliculata TaxID=400727 RepID=UPI000D73F556|nr:glycine, glutamate and proline-rich protein-like isoform X2 [Pomacea canaliculata]